MQVFQVVDSKFVDAMLGKPLNFPVDYKLVADVSYDRRRGWRANLERAFERTNTYAGPWWKNDGVQVIQVGRSTSVGDVVVFKSKRAHRVAGCGFVPVS